MENKQELFERTPIGKALATMAIPTIISQLINLVYNLVDTFFIGRTGNSYMMAAVTVAFTIFMMTVAFSNLFGVGGGSLIARLSGVHDEENAKKVSAFSIAGAIVIALVYSAVIGLCMDPILYLLGASEQTIGFARQYTLVVVVIGNLPMILSATMAHLLRNAGYSKQASFGLGSGGVLNMILDPIFMFVLFPSGMEVLGAALATMLSNVFACTYLLIQMLRLSKSSPLTMDVRKARGIRKVDVTALFSVGVPSMVLTGLFDVANIFLNHLMSVYGDLELAAIGIVMKAERLPNAINLGICQGMLPIVAYNYASGNRKRMDSVIRLGRMVGLAIAAASLILFEIFAKPLIQLFMSTSGKNVENAVATIGLGVTFLQIRCLASPVQFLNYHSSYCMQAMGDGRDTLLHAIFRELVFYVPFMYLLNTLWGKTGLTAALIAGEGCGAVFALFLLNRWIRKKSTEKTGSCE